jgi:hypothetical membrane protein
VFFQVFITLKKIPGIMRFSNGSIAGLLFLIASTQFILGVIIAEALYPGYSVSINTISDLGIGPPALIFNISMILLGLFILIGTYFQQRVFKNKVFTVLLLLTALGAMGVGLITKDMGLSHKIAAVFIFFFGGLSVIYSNKVMNNSYSIIYVLLGLISLIAAALFGLNQYMGLGAGGMERLIVYPILIWIIGFGGYLITLSEKS